MKILAFPLLFVLLSVNSEISADHPMNRPNIVFIFADDLGWKDVGYQGDGFIETPHLDSLAQQGMVFTDAYSTAGNCAPSRACLLSGNYTPRHHVYAVGDTSRGQKNLQRTVAVPNRSGLPSDVVTMADALKSTGYATGHFGKWHLHGKDGAMPTEQGFDVSFDSFGDGAVKEGSEGNKPGPPEDPKGVFTLTRKACEFIEENQHKPFFCYLAHHAIHGPLQGRPESLAKFKSKPLPADGPGPMYAACTYDLDQSVGMLVAKLKELNLDEKTLLIFTSDNGATNQSPQEPLRGSKGGYYEGGIREPCIVRWTGVVQPGTRCSVPITNVDFFPTFLAAADANVPDGKKLDGENLLPLLRGAGELKRKSIFWHFPGYLDSPVIRGRTLDVRTGFRSRPVSVIRSGDWKLHLFHEEWFLDGGQERLDTNHAVELYHLADDMGERNDLSGTNPDKRDELISDLLMWFDATDAKLASEPNPAFDPTAAQEKIDSTDRKRKNRRNQNKSN